MAALVTMGCSRSAPSGGLRLPDGRAGLQMPDDGGFPALDVAREDDAAAGLAGDAAGSAGDWSAVEALLVTRAAAAGVSQMGLTVWNGHDQKLYEHMLGGFTADTRVAVASAAKLVSGLVLFDVIRSGRLSLDSTTGQVLGWTGA